VSKLWKQELAEDFGRMGLCWVWISF